MFAAVQRPAAAAHFASKPGPSSSSQSAQALNDLARLRNEFSESELWVQRKKQDWLDKYAGAPREDGDTEQRHEFGKGASFPEAADDMRLDIPALLQAQPKNVEAEVRFHEELFQKMKFTFVEQKAKEGFLKRVLDVPARFPTQQDVESLNVSAAGKQKLLKNKKQTCKELRDQVEQLMVAAYSDQVAIAEKAAATEQVIQEHGKLEQELANLFQKASPTTSDLSEHELAIAEQDAALAELRAKLAKQQSLLAQQKSSTDTLLAELVRLRAERADADAAASEAEAIARSKDPQLDELGKWYREQTLFLKQIQGVKEIRHPKGNADRIEIVWELDGGVSCTLLVSYKRDGKAPSGYVLDAKFIDSPYPCPLADILHAANTSCHNRTLESMLRHLTQTVPLRIRNLTERERELEALCLLATTASSEVGGDHSEIHNNVYAGVSYEPDTRQVVVHVDAAARTFALRLAENYPAAGARGIEVVAVEPRMDDEVDEAAEWTKRCRDSGVRTVTDFIPMLN
ncbi:hypothetical protein HDU87_001809 [Geranomyces variabilis]|uniref:Kinetochore protein Sos7 coiled-coil domain-containing protein n=1 Tax=Geranomyces variabilis TaxID=109894 RepID=A0AAD5TM43_9FUNG|nr:hypothetical protein HDU87_001809 [Geranomyces variabilis]